LTTVILLTSAIRMVLMFVRLMTAAAMYLSWKNASQSVSQSVTWASLQKDAIYTIVPAEPR